MTTGYQLRRISEPTVEPITLGQAKAQARVDADITDDDDWFREAISEAREAAELYCQSTFVESEWELQAPEFPYCENIDLPMGPLISVSAFTYKDRDGATQSLTPDLDFIGVPHGTAGFLIPGYNGRWPRARAYPGTLVIRYTAGYPGPGSPANADGVPLSIKRALKMTVAHWYANRESQLIGTIVQEMPEGPRDLLQPFRNLP